MSGGNDLCLVGIFFASKASQPPFAQALEQFICSSSASDRQITGL